MVGSDPIANESSQDNHINEMVSDTMESAMNMVPNVTFTGDQQHFATTLLAMIFKLVEEGHEPKLVVNVG